MIWLASLTALLPFLAAFAGMLFGPSLTRVLRGVPGGGPGVLACAPVAVSLVLSAVVAFAVWRDPGERTGTLALVDTGSVPIRVGLQVDGLSAVVGLMVCCVAAAVQVYSVAYMKGDRRYSSYAAFISLFTSAMLLVVYAGDLLVLYAGWEVMGICSYFLIGHHWEERANSRAAVKAFLVTRLGDVGFLIGVIVLGVGAGTFEISGILARATMVAAGVYVVARLYGVFLLTPGARTVLAVIAVVSMVGAACAALAQDDLKRVLAYSTISQLAVMAAGLAVGAKTAAVFPLLTHGAFKALLFLAAGCVIVTAGSNLLAHYGGLWRAMPVTFWSMTVGLAALAGVPPFSGWFSKDSIIEAAQHSATHGGSLPEQGVSAHAAGWVDYAPPPEIASPPKCAAASHVCEALVAKIQAPAGPLAASVVTLPGGAAWLVYLGLLLTVVLTAAYAMRTWLMTFFGEQRGTYEPRDPSRFMSWTVAALAVPAAILGFFGLGAAELRPHLGASLLSAVLVGLGAGAAFLLWNRDPALDPARALGPVRPVFARAFFVDELYAVAIVRPVRALARYVVAFDRRGVDAAVIGTAHGARRLAGVLRVPQNGNPQTYLTGLLAGVVVIVAGVVIFL